MHKKKAILLLSAAGLGFLLAVQSKSFENLNEVLLRDAGSNPFQEIKILKQKNQDLLGEIDELEKTAEQLKDQNSALLAIETQIEKYNKLTGEYGVEGPGISVIVEGNITTPWAIDLVNEMFGTGAEAVSVNDIRLVNETVGLDTLPQGQMLLNGSILGGPYKFNAIGDGSTLANALSAPGGIVERLEATFPGIKIEISRKEIIEMN